MFNYLKICSDFLENLSKRTKEVIEKRFGLKTGEKETLEQIGNSYGVCRERIRQIEKDGLAKIKPRIKKHQAAFRYLASQLNVFGDLKREDIFLVNIAGPELANHIFFLLTIEDQFERVKETDDFYPLWTTKVDSVFFARRIVSRLVEQFNQINRLFSDKEVFEIYKKEIAGEFNQALTCRALFSYLEVSKQIHQNQEGQFGLRWWAEINPCGLKDKAYLALKAKQEPLHFNQIAITVNGLAQSVHNELIKDSRFVLVGRGLYALQEWGYESGFVKDIIFKTLQEAKEPIPKEQILDKVLKQRVVKVNTILMNLQNKKYFLKDTQGRYLIREA